MGKYFLIAALVALSGFASADENSTTISSGPFSLGLTGRVRFEDQGQKDLVNWFQFTSLRLRPSLTYNIPTIASKVILEAQYAKIFGNSIYTATSATGNTFTETSANVTYNGDSINVRQAYFDVDLDYGLHLLAGRQALAYDDEYIVGPSDWGPYGRSFDAARLRWSLDKSYVDVFQAKIVDVNSTSNNADQDKNLFGVYADYAPATIPVLKHLEAYYFNLRDGRDPAAAPANSDRPYTFGVAGGRFVVENWGFKFKSEFARTFGDEFTKAGDTNSPNPGNTENYMSDSWFDYTFSDAMKTTVGLEFFDAGQNWRDLYPTTNWQLGRVDVLGRRNLNGVGLHYRSSWGERFSTDVDIYKYRRTSDSVTAFGTDSKTAINGAGGSKDLGLEEDLVVRYNQTKSLIWSAGACFFQAQGYLKDGTLAKDAHYFFVMAETRL